MKVRQRGGSVVCMMGVFVRIVLDLKWEISSFNEISMDYDLPR
jgi:hypothetical protein